MLTRWISSSPRGTASAACLVSLCLSVQPWRLRTLHPLPTPQNRKTCSSGLETGCKPVLFYIVRSLYWSKFETNLFVLFQTLHFLRGKMVRRSWRRSIGKGPHLCIPSPAQIGGIFREWFITFSAESSYDLLTRRPTTVSIFNFNK